MNLTRPDWMIKLFGDRTDADVAADAARLEAARAADQARVREIKAAAARREAERLASRCSRCSGAGTLPHFMHFKGGVCFTCGGSGVQS